MDSLDISTWQIVKWVLIVLVAAFIGQFGKTFAQYLMHRFRRGKTDAQPAVAATSSAPADVALTTNSGASEASLKAQKKEAKVLLKAKKKDKKNK